MCVHAYVCLCRSIAILSKNQLLDILEESTSNPVAATPIGVKADARSVAQYCFDHVDEELKVYCETCGKLVCILFACMLTPCFQCPV